MYKIFDIFKPNITVDYQVLDLFDETIIAIRRYSNLFDIILVFRFQSSIGIFGFARRISNESIPNISLSTPVESHVTAQRVEGNKCVTNTEMFVLNMTWLLT